MAEVLSWDKMRRMLEFWNDYLDADDEMSPLCRERFEKAVREAFDHDPLISIEWQNSMAREGIAPGPDIAVLSNGYRFSAGGAIELTLASGERVRITQSAGC